MSPFVFPRYVRSDYLQLKQNSEEENIREHFSNFIRNLSLDTTERDMSINEVRVDYDILHEEIDPAFFEN